MSYLHCYSRYSLSISHVINFTAYYLLCAKLHLINMKYCTNGDFLIHTQCLTYFSVSNKQLQVDVLSGLLRVYQKLEKHALFYVSPQRIHLTHTIQKLFQTLSKERTMQIYERFSVTDGRNVGIWSALEIKNVQLLSNDILISVDRFVWDSLFESYNDILGNTEDSLEDLIKLLKLASTCLFVERDLKKEEFLMKAWMKACPTCSTVVLHRSGLNECTVWLYRYLESLASLTESYMEKFETKSLVNILSIISKILQKGYSEIIYLLFKLFCKLSNFLMENRNDVAIMHLFEDTIRTVLQDSYVIIEQNVYNVVVNDDALAKALVPILEDANNTFNFEDYKNKLNDIDEWGKQLELAACNNYTHKCYETTQTCVIEHIDNDDRKMSNFDLGDVDSLFDVSDGEEPASKKMKLDVDVDNLIGRIESDVERLCQVKENILSEYKSRIKCVCDKLRNIIT